MSSKLILGDSLYSYFLEHVKQQRRDPEFYRVVKDLHVFKKVKHRRRDGRQAIAIANLIIPPKSIVYAPNCVFDSTMIVDPRKMRASQAYVHSVAAFNGKACDKGYSAFCPSFYYIPGSTVKPQCAFDKDALSCGSGIHFFLNLLDAKRYIL